MNLINRRVMFFLTGVSVALGIASCKKTDNHYEKLINTPEIYTRLGLDYSRLANGIPRQYHIGDTLQINGRFNAAVSQVSVQIGGLSAAVISIDKKDSIANVDNVSYYSSMETIRIALTGDMGTGRLAVSVNCREVALEGPLLYLLPKGSPPPITDTLVWRQLLNFKAYGSVTTNEALTDSFFTNPVFYPSMSGTGNIFFSVKSKIQLLHPNRTIDQVVDLQGRSDAYGAFSIVKMYNGAVDPQDHNLYFSALTSDQFHTPGTPGSVPDADSNWIFRICKLDLQTHQLRVINRTIVPIYRGKLAAIGSSNQIQAFFTGQGEVSQVNMLPFAKTWVDNAGNIFFIPIGFSNSDFDVTGKVKYYPRLYNTVYTISWSSFFGKITPDGQVQYLMRSRLDWPGNGVIRNAVLSLDPLKDIMFTASNVGGRIQILEYDLNSRSLVDKLFPTTDGAGATGPFSLLDPITPASSGAINYSGYGGDPGRYMPLPGNSKGFLYDLQNIVYNFSTHQAYKYAPVIVDSIMYLAPPGTSYDILESRRQDLPSTILNFDSEGNIYKLAPFYIYIGGGLFNVYYDVRRTYILKH